METVLFPLPFEDVLVGAFLLPHSVHYDDNPNFRIYQRDAIPDQVCCRLGNWVCHNFKDSSQFTSCLSSMREAQSSHRLPTPAVERAQREKYDERKLANKKTSTCNLPFAARSYY